MFSQEAGPSPSCLSLANHTYPLLYCLKEYGKKMYNMEFTGITILTEDVQRLAGFYSDVFSTPVARDDIHVVFCAGNVQIALYSKDAAKQDMAFDFSLYNGVGSVILNFDVDDVDAEYERLSKMSVLFVNHPVVRPWGMKSFQFRDPDGNILTFRKAVSR